MGIIRTTLLAIPAGGITLGTYMSYLASTTTIVDLTKNDPMFKTKTYKKYNPKDNPALQDVVIKRIPLAAVKPELRNDEKALTLEFCRGVWGGFNFWPQTKYQEFYDKPPGTENQLWQTNELKVASFEKGLKFTNHFEVVSNDGNEIVVRCGGSPLQPGLRNSDGLIFFSAKIDRDAAQAEFKLKSALFNSAGTFAKDAGHPIPPKIEFLHRWYVRMLTSSGVGNVRS
ncbi:uncharacterized protein GGS22DRAFT_156333 [Annulohypoxylon maeteangense]|uniref:uncharacterized protein n=1 Tax=Annulohypoxylon maeteangense TaxID=1927788 RepID=UPI002007A543|nr:uncharacterized protein GGS22DRAFT_156333 [Annulohypoxylon maeteangense]KAI0887163.1 hypothetical protein GGS22DRAFT_156333 [Annulohypoxylon maeteangense]